MIVKKNKKECWYIALWSLEESESIYGLAFITFQYIGSINYLYDITTSVKVNLYSIIADFKNYKKNTN